MVLIHQVIQDTELGKILIALGRDAATDKVCSPQAVYVPSCLLPDLLIDIRLPLLDWGILWDITTRLLVYE